MFSEPLLETNLVLYLDYLDVFINKIYNILDQDTSFDLLLLFLLASTYLPPILAEQRLSTEPSLQPVFKNYSLSEDKLTAWFFPSFLSLLDICYTSGIVSSIKEFKK